MKKLSYLFIILFGLSLIATSCREEKTTSEKVEEALEDTGDAIEDVADDVADSAEDTVESNK